MEQMKIKTFPLRMTDKLNQELRIVAAKENTTMHKWIMEAIAEKLAKCDKAV